MYDEMNKDMEYDKYMHSLDDCREVADSEIKKFTVNLREFKRLLEISNKDLDEFLSRTRGNSDFRDDELVSHIDDLSREVKDQINKGLKSIEESFKKKEQNADSFTVTLFGRTKAGKSTIREALTSGDGSSIGKGAQRTTRDVYKYRWNNLRIIDTPGIAAFEGEKDVEIAESVIDESDLILFLVTSDSVQVTEFMKLVELKAQNKPVIILLNVKMDIDNPLRQKTFLKNHYDVISEKGQKGNIERIRELSKKYIGISSIEIITIHAMAAYKSTQVIDEELSRKLYNASNVNVLKNKLREVIINQGTQKRMLTFRDDYIFYLNSIENIYWQYYKKIKPRVRYMSGKLEQMQNWFYEFKERGSKQIDDEIKKIFSPIYVDIIMFVDENAGNKSAQAIWNKKIHQLDIVNKCNKMMDELKDEVKTYLEEFSKQLVFETSNINFDYDLSGISALKKGVIGRVARWGGATVGVAEGAIIVGVLLNWWNPAGWVMASIGAVSIAITGFGLIYGDDSKKFEKKKSKLKKKLEMSIKLQEEELKGNFGKWFRRDIVKSLRANIEIEFKNNINSMNMFSIGLNKSASNLGKEIEEQNRKLIYDLIDATFVCKVRGDIIKIVREQGKLMKILAYEGNEILGLSINRKRLESILGERIVYVEFTDDPLELLKRAIIPARVNNDSIFYDSQNNKYVLKITKDLMGQVLGENGANIKLTSRLLNAKIDVVEV